MFRRSAPSSQPDLFSSFESHFKGPKLDRLNDSAAWNNVFYEHITSRSMRIFFVWCLTLT